MVSVVAATHWAPADPKPGPTEVFQLRLKIKFSFSSIVFARAFSSGEGAHFCHSTLNASVFGL